MAQQMEVSNYGNLLEGPICLVDTDKKSNKIFVVEESLRQLERLDRPLVVVAIAGLYRTGKSFLLNRLFGANKGFSLGPTIQSHTKGIWIWARDHPSKPGHYLVVLDTEGLGDPEKGDANHDSHIFCLAALLSSTIIYNAQGQITDDALQKLNFIMEMSNHIRIKSSQKERSDEDFDLLFPLFIYVLRDFTLELILDGKDITEDEYLEFALKLNPEHNVDGDTLKRNQRRNEPRKCIRKYFKTRKCFTFEMPTTAKKLKYLETMRDDELNEDFLAEATKFCNYIFANAKVKHLGNGQQVRGNMLASLTSTYVDAIRKNVVLCIENAVNSMAATENPKAVEKALELYRSSLLEKVTLPTESDKELADAHFVCLKEAVKYFLDHVIFDDDHQYQQLLNATLEEEYKSFAKSNENESSAKCRQVLSDLSKPMSEKLANGDYAVPGGYQDYQKDLNQVQVAYQATTGLGVKMKDVLLAFLKEKWVEGESVMAADREVTQMHRQAEEERRNALEKEKEAETARREAELVKQHAEERERAMKENIEQMEKHREEQIRTLQEHYEKIMMERISEQQRLLQEGFDKQVRLMESQIASLRSQILANQGGGGGCTIL